MDPMMLTSLLQMAPGGIESLKGLGQIGLGAYQAFTNKRPEEVKYEIPNEIKQILAMAKARSSNPFPEGDRIRSEMGAQLGGAVQQTNQMAGGSGSSLGAIADIYGKQLSTMNQLALKEFEAKKQAEDNLSGALGTMADYGDKQWDVNVRQPYVQKLQEYFSKRSSATSNIFGGLNSMYGGASSLGENDDLISSISKLFGKKNTPTTNSLGSTFPTPGLSSAINYE